MGEELNLSNILDTSEIENLFNEDVSESTEKNYAENNEEEKNNDKTTEVNPEDLFEDIPESVGSEEDTRKKEDVPSKQSDGTSPKNNFYSSIAKALKEEGIFPDLDDNVVDSATSAEAFRALVENQIKSEIDERQRRIDDALNVGLEPSEIKKFEQTLNYLDSIKEESITDESEKGELLRKQLIFQDFINRGYTRERAEREVNKSFNAGSDIEDAKEALLSNKEYFESEYNNLIEDAKKEEEALKKEIEENNKLLKKSILDETKVFGDINLDKITRQKIFDNISKPVYKDPKTGTLYTAIQKYEKENRNEFLKNVGVLFTLTDGFKNLDKLVNNKVKKEVKKGLRELETVLNSTSRNFDGNLQFVSGVNSDSESSARSWDLDI